MFTSDTDKVSQNAYRTALIYLAVTIFCVLLGFVYELNSNHVYSYFMLYAFAFPLLGGVLPFFLAGFFKPKEYPSLTVRCLWHCGIATLTTGSVFKGVLEIYGTTNALSIAYWIAGPVLCLAGILLYVLQSIKK